MIKWIVYNEDFNRKQIKEFNIFDHYSFLKKCIKAAKEHKKDKEEFLHEVKLGLIYYFWSKCEWEIILSDWPPSDTFNSKKVSVYDQVMLNWHVFSEYIWEHKSELKKYKRQIDKQWEKWREERAREINETTREINETTREINETTRE